MDYLGGAPLGGRTREEIVDRLMEQAAEAAAVRLDKSAVELIERVLSVSGPARKSIAGIAALLKKSRIALDEPLAQMEARIAALTKLGLSEKRISFAARFGRNMEYYTGFVFELWSRDAEGRVQVAGGGRYDTLLRTLGASKDIPAVGCAIRPERVLAARRATGAL
jgi:ATP phosphoribosyltransferase regulatory subunit